VHDFLIQCLIQFIHGQAASPVQGLVWPWHERLALVLSPPNIHYKRWISLQWFCKPHKISCNTFAMVFTEICSAFAMIPQYDVQ
jgi:hypothetical protein